MVLITGSTGFVGRNLINFILKELPDLKIRAFTRSIPESGLWLSEVETVTGSLNDKKSLKGALSGIDTVIHLAAKINVKGNKEEMWNTNVQGTKNLYVTAIDSGCKHFIHMSTAAVYGIPNSDEPRSEEHPAIPDSVYGASKLGAEKELLSIDSKGCVLNILRCAGVYGIGTKKEVPLLQKIRLQKYVFELPGGLVYNPINIKDVTKSILAVLEKPAAHKSIFNIGGNEEILLNDYYALIAKKLGVNRKRYVIPKFIAIPVIFLFAKIKSNPVLPKLASGKIVHAGVNINKFRKLYTVSMIPIAEGVEEYVNWVRKEGLL